MARRSEHSQEKLKEMAIDSGFALLDERGLKDFSARAAAAHMGYTVGTLYHLFGTLDTYMLHINARTLDEWHAYTLKTAPKRGGLTLRHLAQSYLAYARAHYNRWSALFEHRMQDDAPVPDWYAPKMLRMFTLAEEAVLPLAGNPERARKLAKLLWAGIHGVCTLSLAGKLEQVQADPAEKMIDDFISLAVPPKSK
jgi:AcrR family transcriptional regulator